MLSCHCVELCVPILRSLTRHWTEESCCHVALCDILNEADIFNFYICFFAGLDASLLPLRQSDMCLVCIAFASWVLKTANPQVGDTWKAGMYVITLL